GAGSGRLPSGAAAAAAGWAGDRCGPDPQPVPGAGPACPITRAGCSKWRWTRTQPSTLVRGLIKGTLQPTGAPPAGGGASFLQDKAKRLGGPSPAGFQGLMGLVLVPAVGSEPAADDGPRGHQFAAGKTDVYGRDLPHREGRLEAVHLLVERPRPYGHQAIPAPFKDGERPAPVKGSGSLVVIFVDQQLMAAVASYRHYRQSVDGHKPPHPGHQRPRRPGATKESHLGFFRGQRHPE